MTTAFAITYGILVLVYQIKPALIDRGRPTPPRRLVKMRAETDPPCYVCEAGPGALPPDWPAVVCHPCSDEIGAEVAEVLPAPRRIHAALS